jgi:transcriptional regulator with XRE-family HTH domain
MTLQQLIDKIKNEAGLTQVQIAKMLGVTETTVSRWRRGAVYTPHALRTAQLLWLIIQNPSPGFNIATLAGQLKTLDDGE